MAKDKLPERQPGATNPQESGRHGENVKPDTSRFTDRPLPTGNDGDDLIQVVGADGQDEIEIQK